MDRELSHNGSELTADKRPSTMQIIVFATAAAAAATLVGIATYAYFLRRAASSPQGLLNRCREAIDQIERGLEVAGHA